MKKWKILVILVFASYIFSFFIITIFSGKINKILTPYVNFEAERITNNVINSVASSIIINDLSTSLFKITRNDSNEIELIDFNSKKVNQLLTKVNKQIYNKLLNLDEGNLNDISLSSSIEGAKYKYINNGLVCEIPVGSLSGNSFFSNLGPIIPLKMSFMGMVSSSVRTKVTSYGLNSLFLEIYISVEIKERISLPKSSDVITIVSDIPIGMQVISGKIPDYYGGLIDSNSKMSFFSVK